MPMLRREVLSAPPPMFPPRDVYCECCGRKTKHYYLRPGPSGKIYVCAYCGEEKTVKK